MISPRAFINRHNTVTAGNRSHKAPLVVQATVGALATASVIYLKQRLIRITVYPLKGSVAETLAEPAYRVQGRKPP